jgi:hypothetical protein
MPVNSRRVLNRESVKKTAEIKMNASWQMQTTHAEQDKRSVRLLSTTLAKPGTLESLIHKPNVNKKFDWSAQRTVANTTRRVIARDSATGWRNEPRNSQARHNTVRRLKFQPSRHKQSTAL